MSKKKTLSEQVIENSNKVSKEMADAREAPMDANESIVQAEGAAHNADVDKADKKTRKGRKQKAESKAARPREAKAIVYPLELFVNKYGFMRFSNALLADLGWEAHTDINVKVTKTATGLAIERA